MTQGRTMKHLVLGLVVLFGLSALSHAAEPNPLVVLDTSKGPITIELDPAHAPITVANFLKYVDSGFYDGLIFHRVMPDFMIQGGGFNAKMQEKSEGQGPPIKNEGANGLANARGTIAMARRPNPDSATSQFFLNHGDNTNKLCPGGVDPFGYAVFGKVIDGMEVVDAIAKVPTGQVGPHGDVPQQPILIKSAKRKAKS